MTDSSNEKVLLFEAPLVLPMTSPALMDGAVAVRGSRILHVGSRKWVEDRLAEELQGLDGVERRLWRGIITPGLVNAHTHLQYSGMASVGRGSYASFRAWQLGFNAIYDDPAPKPWHAWALEGARLLAEAGTTAAADIVTDIEAADALEATGLHGISYLEVMDWDNVHWRENGMTMLKSRLASLRAHGAGMVGISPHAPYSLGTEPLLDLTDFARQHSMRLHIHLGEAPMEAARGPEASDLLAAAAPIDIELFDDYVSYARRPRHASAIRFVDCLGALGPDVHIAHGVHASAVDRRILRERRSAVALCPRSNAITCAGGEAPIAAYLREGNAISVGTDSLSSSPSLDVLDDVALLYAMAREQGYGDADLASRLIIAATLGGAAAMGLAAGPDRIGQINAGALADLAFFEIGIAEQDDADAVGQAVEELARHGAGRCRATMCAGRMLYDRIWT